MATTFALGVSAGASGDRSIISGQTISGAVVGDPVWNDDGTWKKATSVTNTPAGVMSAAGTVILYGRLDVLSGLTAGKYYYLAEAGGLTTTYGPVKIGMALSSTELLVDIDANKIPDMSTRYIQFNGVYSNPGVSTLTFNSPIGTDNGNRYVAIVVMYYNITGSSNTITSATIGGVSATQLIKVANTAASNPRVMGIYLAKVPTITNGDIVITASAASSQFMCAVYTVYGLSSTTAFHTVSKIQADPYTLSLNVPSSGIVITGVSSSTTDVSPTVSWNSPLQETFDIKSNNLAFSSAFAYNQSLHTMTVTADVSTAGGYGTTYSGPCVAVSL